MASAKQLRNRKLLLLVIAVAAVVGFIGWRIMSERSANSVQSFAACVAAGNPVMESFPEQCTADGKTFTKEVPSAEYAVSTTVPASWKSYTDTEFGLTFSLPASWEVSKYNYKDALSESGVFKDATINVDYCLKHRANSQWCPYKFSVFDISAQDYLKRMVDQNKKMMKTSGGDIQYTISTVKISGKDGYKVMFSQSDMNQPTGGSEKTVSTFYIVQSGKYAYYLPEDNEYSSDELTFTANDYKTLIDSVKLY